MLIENISLFFMFRKNIEQKINNKRVHLKYSKPAMHTGRDSRTAIQRGTTGHL